MLAKLLANADRGSIVAPAGFGKTHLIAESISHQSKGRALILTHTYAGVDALKRRLSILRISTKDFTVETIAAFALKYCIGYPKLAVLSTDKPKTEAEWRGIYIGFTNALQSKGIRNVISTSYSGFYVDEYQDCSEGQHEIVLKLAEILPCRVLGDPLQSIFNFKGTPTVIWDKHVTPNFKVIGQMDKPWRWEKGNVALGDWLKKSRESLISKGVIEIEKDSPVNWVKCASNDANAKSKICWDFLKAEGTTAVLKEWRTECVALAWRLGGNYSPIETMECRMLMDTAKALDNSTGIKRAETLINFAVECFTGVKTEFASANRRLLGDDKRLKPFKFPEQLERLRVCMDNFSPTNAVAFLESIRDRKDIFVLICKELYFEMLRALEEFSRATYPSLEETAWHTRNITRKTGRTIRSHVIGTTLLVKGLEYDNVIVLDPERYDINNLYVAITRGSKTLTIASPSPLLTPKKT
jgi:hypothetical protein